MKLERPIDPVEVDEVSSAAYRRAEILWRKEGKLPPLLSKIDELSLVKEELARALLRIQELEKELEKTAEVK